MRVDESAEHILAECPAYDGERDKVIGNTRGFSVKINSWNW